MKNIFLVILLIVITTSYGGSADAKKMIFGDNKGKKVLTDRQTEQKNVDMINESVQSLLKSQNETNKLLQQLIKSMSNQAQVTQGMLRNNLAAKNKTKKSQPVQEQKSVRVDTANLEKLQKETNRLLKKLIEEQKWLGAIINSKESEHLIGK
jgi:hypothetical protein